MTIEIKEFTVQQVIDAIAENGLDHLRGQWFHETYDGKLTGGCVLGQGAFNLKVLAEDESGDDLPKRWDEWDNVYIHEFDINKTGGQLPTLVNQLDRFHVQDKVWDIGHTGCGGTIATWNDKTDQDDDGDFIGYTLPTYADVLNMVKEVLAPYVEETVYLAAKDYSIRNGPLQFVGE